MISVGGIVSLGGGSSGGGGSTSGIQSINGQTGPAVVIVGGSGIQVTAAGNVITISASGTGGSSVNKFAASFSSISSGLFTHGLGTLDVIVQVHDNASPRKVMMPDKIIIENTNQISLIFNKPQSGRVVVI